jgi:Mrp family chromosome partitioning ATPase
VSWIYEALLRAEQERPKSEKERGASVSDQDGNSFLSAVESLSALSEHARSGPEPSPAVPRQENVPAVSAALPGQVTPAALESKWKSPNGFRQVALAARDDSRLVYHANPHGLAAEQFRVLRRNLHQQLNASGVLMLTSPGAGDGKTFCSLNLCASLADSGEATLFLEMDLRKPTARKLLGLPNESRGIEDVLVGSLEPAQAIDWIKDLSLHVATVAKAPKDPSHLVTGAGIGRFLRWAREHFRWIVIDAATVLPAADVVEMLPLVNATLLVIRAQTTPRELSRQAFEMLGKQLRGVIWNDATIHSNPYSRYLSQYYHGAAPGSK